MLEFLAAKTFNLPRWAWASLLVGSLGLGLYLRHNNKMPEGKESGEVGEVETTNTGNVVPPASPIGGIGGDGGSINPPQPKPGGFVPVENVKRHPASDPFPELPWVTVHPEPEDVEIPDSDPPPERIVNPAPPMKQHKKRKPPLKPAPRPHKPPKYNPRSRPRVATARRA